MDDNQLNEILTGRGLRALASRQTNEDGEEVRGLKRDKHLFRAKKQNKGVHWDSLLNDTADRVNAFLQGQVQKLTWTSEYYEHLLPQIQTFLDTGRVEGLYQEEDLWGFSTQTTKELTARREKGEQVPLTPGLLLADFASDVADVSNRIRSVVQELAGRLRERDATHRYEEETQRWLVDTARKVKVLDREEDHRLAQLLDEKERIIAYYRGQADQFRLGDSDLADALAFAAMWEMVMLEQSERARDVDSATFSNAVDAFKNEFGFDPHADPRILKLLRDRIPKYQYSRLSSVLTLFPRGAMQFLDLVENQRVTKYAKPVQHMVGFFGHPELTPAHREQLKRLEGKPVILYEGRLVGTRFQFATEDYGQTGYATSDPRQVMTREGYPSEVVDMVCSHKYLRGGKVWTGGLQQATLLFAETTRKNGTPMANGAKLWLENIQTLDVSEEVMTTIQTSLV